MKRHSTSSHPYLDVRNLGITDCVLVMLKRAEIHIASNTNYHKQAKHIGLGCHLNQGEDDKQLTKSSNQSSFFFFEQKAFHEVIIYTIL